MTLLSWGTTFVRFQSSLDITLTGNQLVALSKLWHAFGALYMCVPTYNEERLTLTLTYTLLVGT